MCNTNIKLCNKILKIGQKRAVIVKNLRQELFSGIFASVKIMTNMKKNDVVRREIKVLPDFLDGILSVFSCANNDRSEIVRRRCRNGVSDAWLAVGGYLRDSMCEYGKGNHRQG